MKPGTLIADRYEIVQLAGVGGMAEVHRARDRQTSAQVAIKILFDGYGSGEEERFDREIAALESLDHSGIVRLLDHGSLSFGARYLVMEWLEGGDLDHYLASSRMSVDDALVLARRLAEALGTAHARGIVHRDLKPANVFLLHNRPDKPKILDFGIAKLSSRSRITVAGSLMGTPGFMAPEQIRSEMTVDARADIFALGCLLFQCLAGAPPFSGDGIQAILAKVLFAEPVRLRDHRPDVPLSIEAFVMGLLAKDPEARPRDGRAVEDLLDQLEYDGADSRVWRTERPASLTATERRPVAALLIGRSRNSIIPPGSSAPQASDVDRAIQKEAEALEVPCEFLPDGSLALWMSGAAVATDLASRAANLALMLRKHADARPFALSVGWGALSGKNPLGDAIDRAAHTISIHRAFTEGEECPIVLDAVTAGLLDSRFDVREIGDELFALRGERPTLPGARTLLGKPTTCVGRDRELNLLAGLFDHCVDEGVPQAALVTSAPGLGKSRLAHEFVRATLARHPDIALWVVGADVLRAGSAYDLASRALAIPMGFSAHDSAETRRKKIVERVSLRAAKADADRIAKFLGEIAGAPFSDVDDLPLRSARASPQLMVDQIRAAFVEFFAAECSVKPILLVIEDLQWGDLPTVRLLDTVLRDVKDQSLLILALARPEVHERFPKLWAGRRMQEITLLELGKKASERLVRQALGESANQALIDRIVAQAQGNSFYLEELVRAAAEGRSDEFPETVVAMVQSRLHSLHDDDRRILRAASLFGEAFWAGGVQALLGKHYKVSEVIERLTHLATREMISVRHESRFSGESEYAFRHALVREGAFAMLTEGDRLLGHRLAGEWLEAQGETDPLVLAEHFERGGVPQRAAVYYLRAAERAHRAGDDDAAIRRSEHGLSLEPDPETHIGLLGIVTETRMWRNQLDESSITGAKLTRIAPPGSAPWVRGALAQFNYAMRQGHIDESIGLLDVIRSIDPAPEVLGTLSLALAMATVMLLTEGRIELVEPIQRRLEALVAPVADKDPMARAFWHLAYPRWEAWIKEDPWNSLQRAQAAYDAFTEAGSRRGQYLARVFIGMNEWLLGQASKACETLHIDTKHEEEFAIVASLRSMFRILALLDLGDQRTARTEAEQLIAASKSKGTAADVARGRWALAEVYRRAGVAAFAEREARVVLELKSAAPLDLAAASAIVAASCLADKRPAEALLAIRDAAARYEKLCAFGYRGAFMRVVLVEVLDAAGHHGEARERLADARQRLLDIAASIPDEQIRRSYLHQVPEHARTLDLAEKWFGKMDD